MNKKIIIIGAGMGGLASGIRLAARGYRVHILEKQNRPGGKAAGLDINEFHFDSGLSLIPSAFLIDDLFNEGGRKTSDFIHMIPLDPAIRIFGNEGRVYTKLIDSVRNQQQLERINPVDKIGYQRFNIHAQQLFQKYFAVLATRRVSLTQMLKLMLDMYRNQDHMPVYHQVSDYFQDEFLREVFSLNNLSIGSNPFTAPGFLAMMHHMEREWGYFYPVGGISALVDALKRYFEQIGGTISFQTEVEEVLFQGRTAVGVRLKDKSILYADTIISDVDTPYFCRQMLPESHQIYFPDWRVRYSRFSMSYFILYLGVRRRYLDRGLVHQNVHLSNNFPQFCTDLFDEMTLSEDMTLYINMPTFSDNTIAPVSHEIIKIISPVPNLRSGIDWEKNARPYRDRIIRFLEKHYFPDLRSQIVAEHHVTPLYFQNQLNCFLGAAFSLQPTLFQTGWFRPQNRLPGLHNLYVVGDGAYPGPGLASTLLSAKITADLI